MELRSGHVWCNIFAYNVACNGLKLHCVHPWNCCMHILHVMLHCVSQPLLSLIIYSTYLTIVWYLFHRWSKITLTKDKGLSRIFYGLCAALGVMKEGGGARMFYSLLILSLEIPPTTKLGNCSLAGYTPLYTLVKCAPPSVFDLGYHTLGTICAFDRWIVAQSFGNYQLIKYWPYSQ